MAECSQDSVCTLTFREVARRMNSDHIFEDYPGTELGDVHEPGTFGGRKPVSCHNNA